jgi:hypothetical protein
VSLVSLLLQAGITVLADATFTSEDLQRDIKEVRNLKEGIQGCCPVTAD